MEDKSPCNFFIGKIIAIFGCFWFSTSVETFQVLDLSLPREGMANQGLNKTAAPSSPLASASALCTEFSPFSSSTRSLALPQHPWEHS